MDTDILNLVIDPLSQLPVLAVVWWLFIKPMMDGHRESLDYYRQRQKEVDDWMRRMMEVWAGQALDNLDAQQKKNEGETGGDPSAP